MKCFVMISILLLGKISFAQNINIERLVGGEENHFGVSIRGGLGISDFEIKNQSTRAIYSGFAVDTNLSIPIWQNPVIAFNSDFSFRYFDLSNNANSASSKEFLKMQGPGIGLNMNFYRLLIGVNYFRMKGQHYWVGNPNGELAYTMDMFTSFIGLHFSVSETIDVLFSYTSSNGSLPRESTNFNTDADLKSNTFWIHLNYGAGETLSEFFTRIFN